MEESTALKVCRLCKHAFPATLEHFKASKDKARIGAFQATCRECMAAKKSVPEGSQWCTTCRAYLPATLEHFLPRASARSGLTTECRSCQKQRVDRWKVEHPDRYAEIQHQSRLKNRNSINARSQVWVSENKERRLEISASYRRRNLTVCRAREERYRKQNPEKVKASAKRFHLLHPHVSIQAYHKRRARLKSVGGVYKREDVLLKLEQQDGKCYWCSEPLDGKYQIDHIIPISKGGSNWPSNIALAHARCNLRKNAKMPWEFAGRLI